jgi:hypothetical protein
VPISVPAKIHPFLYFLPRRDPQRNHHHVHTRDDGAVRELLYSQVEKGSVYGDPIFNMPPNSPHYPPQDPKGRVSPEYLVPVDLSFVSPGDLFLQATRPPLNDVQHEDRKRIERGYTLLEETLFEVWRQYFDYCCRSRIELSRRVVDLLREGYEDRAKIQFYQHWHCGYRKLKSRDSRKWRETPGSRLTAAFLLRVEELWPEGPGYLAAFGMDGTATQAWTYLLHREMPQWLERPGFTMVELECSPVPERTHDLRWAHDWKVEPIVHVPL